VSLYLILKLSTNYFAALFLPKPEVKNIVVIDEYSILILVEYHVLLGLVHILEVKLKDFTILFPDFNKSMCTL